MRFGAAASLAEEGEVDDADGAAEPLDEPTQDVAAVAAGITAIMPLTIADDDEYFEYEHALAHVAIESTATMPLTADYERNDGCFESESRSAEQPRVRLMANTSNLSQTPPSKELRSFSVSCPPPSLAYSSPGGHNQWGRTQFMQSPAPATPSASSMKPIASPSHRWG